MKLVKNEVPEILEYGISNRPLLHPGQQEFQHHVVGEKDLRWGFAHRLPPLLFFLAGVLAEADGKNPPCVPLVVFLIGVEFVGLRVDQRIHRIDDDCGYSLSPAISEQVIEDCADIGQ